MLFGLNAASCFAMSRKKVEQTGSEKSIVDLQDSARKQRVISRHVLLTLPASESNRCT
jgi:hypothetical protein